MSKKIIKIKKPPSREQTEFKIKGFKEVSLLEWQGKLASILFLAGCNLRCPFCHASALVFGKNLPTIPFEEIKNYLNSKKGWLDAVAISGGEPTLNAYLEDLIIEIKKIGMAVMLETNGTNPDEIEKLIKNKRLDYISMDIKTSLGKKYTKACGVEVDLTKIKKSISLIMNSGLDYEFRTTAVPGIVSGEDIKQIASFIKGAKKLCIQQFEPSDTLDKNYSTVKPYKKEILQQWASAAEKNIRKAVIRNT